MKNPSSAEVAAGSAGELVPGCNLKWLKVLHSYFLYIHKDSAGTDEQFAVHVRDIIRQRLQAQDNPAMSGQVNSSPNSPLALVNLMKLMMNCHMKLLKLLNM